MDIENLYILYHHLLHFHQYFGVYAKVIKGGNIALNNTAKVI